MHYSAFKFVDTILQRLPLDKTRPQTIVEIGSLDINGTVRDSFKKYMPIQSYTGVDVGEGAGVDVVCSGDELDSPDNSIDIAISTECFEHNPKWKETFINMHRILKEGGLLIMTCASTGRPEHGTKRSESTSSPLTLELWGDYYKNLNEDDFKKNLDMSALFSCYRFYYNPYSYDLYFVGYKKTDNEEINTLNIDSYISYSLCCSGKKNDGISIVSICWRLNQIARYFFQGRGIAQYGIRGKSSNK
ncbi:MAG: class I SAM-dependent methyltransferase [Proteobacteria bacterium]|nr:class I SAM-dependent methyltransferase [Pseudomonadota bacterium]